MRTFAALTLAGVTGLVLLKVLATLVFPLFALLLGLIALTIKLALLVAVGYFVYSMVRKGCYRSAA